MAVTESNKFAAEVHDCMPVILECEQFDAWMQTKDVREATEMPRQGGGRLLVRRAVSKRINSLKTPKDDPSLT